MWTVSLGKITYRVVIRPLLGFSKNSFFISFLYSLCVLYTPAFAFLHLSLSFNMPPSPFCFFQMSPFLYPKLLSSVIFRVKHTRSVLLSLYNVCGALCSELHVFQWTGTVHVGNEAVTLEAAVNPNASHTCITVRCGFNTACSKVHGHVF